MVRSNPYTPSETKQFECRQCHARVASDTRLDVCPDCGGHMQNLSVPRD